MKRDRRVGIRGELIAVIIGYGLEDMVHARNNQELRVPIALLEMAGVFNRYLEIGGPLHDEDGSRDFGDLFRRVVAEPGDQVGLDTRAKVVPELGRNGIGRPAGFELAQDPIRWSGQLGGAAELFAYDRR